MERRVFGRASRRIRRSGRIVVRSPNAVHSVLYRVVVFVNGSVLRFLLQVEFIARILRVVYVGAIAVLFRFVVMMLNLSETVTRVESQSNWRVGGRRSGVLRGFRMLKGMKNTLIPYTRGKAAPERTEPTGVVKYVDWVVRRDDRKGMSAFGQVLYTDGRIYVVGAGMVLLVSMIGAIVLTLKVRTFARAKRQHVDQQRSRDADRALMMVSNKQ
jgi:NADH-quinone oxidoreductase subunit J